MSEKYPRYSNDIADLSRCIDTFLLDDLPKRPLISSSTYVVTLGSCFARNIHDALERRGVKTKHTPVEEASNSPPGGARALATAPESAKAVFARTDLFIFTMGVSLEFPSRDEWRFCSVEENVGALRQITAILRGLSPNMQIVYTVSPVPLNRALGLGMSAVMADCVSKSTLRVAVDAYMRDAPEGVTYWPSFEMIRWLGAHTGPMYGQDDQLLRHVNQSAVEIVVDKFLQHYSSI